MASNKKKPAVAGKDIESTESQEKGTVTEQQKPEAKQKTAKPKKEKPATPAHMSKVHKFKERLPSLSPEAKTVFESASSLSTGDLNVLAIHLSTLARERATANAASVKINVGDYVRIHSSHDPRFIGREGIVSEVRRIRIFVNVEGFERPAYLFTTNVEVVRPVQIDVSNDEGDDETAMTGTDD